MDLKEPAKRVVDEICIEDSQFDMDKNFVIPLAVKGKGGQQVFKIPFKNVGEEDIEVEFKFLNASQAVNEAAIKRSDSFGNGESEN